MSAGEAGAEPSAPEPTEPGPSTELPGASVRTYESAVARVEEIIRRLDSGDAGLRETLDLVAEGRELVEYCAGELEAVSKGLQELRLDELVTRLETR
ncbi:MAG: exodeoxyribonuclease VII small subunit [Solirubrobacteraceae bacterium]